MKRRQTFENFIVDGINFAKVFAFELAEASETLYNPFCIYGRSGSGKTHLLRAIQNHNRCTKNSMYITCKEFMNKFAYIYRLDCIDGELNKELRNIDILLIDNIEFLSKSTLVQKVFLDVFNYMMSRNKQIVVALKGDVKELPYHIYEVICWGLYIETQISTFIQRKEVIKNEIQYCNDEINEEVINYIAINIYTDMRSTLRCLKKIIKICKDKRVVPDIAICKKYLVYDIMSQLREKIVPEYVIKTVADIFNISVDELMSETEHKYERSMAIYMCWKEFDLKLDDLKMIFGNRTDKEIVEDILGIEKLFLYSNGDAVGQINAVNYRIMRKEGIENVDMWDFFKYRAS